MPQRPRPLLLVEDDEHARFLFARSAVKAGFKNRVDAVESGERAIAYLAECASLKRDWPAIVFLDIHMPQVDGFEVLRWIRERGYAAKMVVVMHSSSEDPEHIRKAFREGANAFLPKSQVPKFLRELVDSADSFSLSTAARNFGPQARRQKAARIGENGK